MEEDKEDHLQTQREEMEDQVQAHEGQEMERTEGRRSSARLKDKPRVNYNEVELARPREDDNVAFMTIAEEGEGPKEVFALAASKDPDTMYYHKAMREPDREQFKGASHEARSGGTHQKRSMGIAQEVTRSCHQFGQ